MDDLYISLAAHYQIDFSFRTPPPSSLAAAMTASKKNVLFVLSSADKNIVGDPIGWYLPEGKCH